VSEAVTDKSNCWFSKRMPGAKTKQQKSHDEKRKRPMEIVTMSLHLPPPALAELTPGHRHDRNAPYTQVFLSIDRA
jgi:hypothetical protein